MSGTYFDHGEQGQYPSVLLAVSSLRFIGVIGDLWERLEFVVLRKERRDPFHIDIAVGFEEVLDDLQLGSGSIDVDRHNGHACTFVPVELL